MRSICSCGSKSLWPWLGKSFTEPLVPQILYESNNHNHLTLAFEKHWKNVKYHLYPIITSRCTIHIFNLYYHEVGKQLIWSWMPESRKRLQKRAGKIFCSFIHSFIYLFSCSINTWLCSSHRTRCWGHCLQRHSLLGNIDNYTNICTYNYLIITEMDATVIKTKCSDRVSGGLTNLRNWGGHSCRSDI